jgi:hypothetical protein
LAREPESVEDARALGRHHLIGSMLLAVLAAGVVASGCVYQPKIPDGAIRCDEIQRCPRGMICNAVRNGAEVLLVCCRNVGCGGLSETKATPPAPAQSPPPTTPSHAAPSDAAPPDDGGSGQVTDPERSGS